MGQISTGRFNLFIYKGSTWTMGKHLRLPMERLMVVRRTIMRGQGLTGYCIGLSGLSLTHYGPVWGFLSRNQTWQPCWQQTLPMLTLLLILIHTSLLMVNLTFGCMDKIRSIHHKAKSQATGTCISTLCQTNKGSLIITPLTQGHMRSYGHNQPVAQKIPTNKVSESFLRLSHNSPIKFTFAGGQDKYIRFYKSFMISKQLFSLKSVRK